MILRVREAFEQFPQLETGRLILREITRDDAPAIFALFSDEEVVRYYNLFAFEDVESAYRMIDTFTRRFAEKSGIRWGITLKGDDILIGTCGYTVLNAHRLLGVIGYDLLPAHWNKGIMTEALGALVAFGFKTLGLNRIEAETMLGNVASMRVLHKLGFKEEGILRERGCWKGEFHDLRMFGLLRREWVKRSRLNHE